MNQIELNDFDRLLYYLSHTGELSWEKLKQAIDRLTKGQPPFQYTTYLRSLARLGHLDYDPENLDRVVIAPTILVETAVADRYVLVGSRTPDFLTEIEAVVLSRGGTLDWKKEICAPTMIVLNGLTEAAFATIEGLGVHISRAFSAKLLSVLPSPKLISFRTIENLPDVPFETFNIDTLEYDKNHPIREDGLYRFIRYGRYVHLLKLGRDLREVPREWGKWLVLREFRKTGLIRYEQESQAWCVKAKLGVPLLAERCATLCSGFPPKRKGSFVRYPDVPIGVAFRLAESLYQQLEVV